MLENFPTLNGKILPSFACAGDKKPLTKNGYKDATTDKEEFLRQSRLSLNDAFLYGVPTGELTGFDILDVDRKGLEWFDNQGDLKTNRWHRTFSGGYHVFFEHHPGLRNSASKIAPGIDVRADGGYIIWWPSTGLATGRPTIITPWPNWITDLLLKQNEKEKEKDSSCMGVPDRQTENANKAKITPKSWFKYDECMELLYYDHDEESILTQIYRCLIVEMRSGTPIGGESYTVRKFSREYLYALQAITQAFIELSNAQPGERNNKLNALAYKLGRLMARSWITPRLYIRALWRGAMNCRLATDDGPQQVTDTILSGLTAGLKNPYPDLDDKDTKE